MCEIENGAAYFALEQAVYSVRRGNISIAKASKHYGVAGSTLYRHLGGKAAPQTDIIARYLFLGKYIQTTTACHML